MQIIEKWDLNYCQNTLFIIHSTAIFDILHSVTSQLDKITSKNFRKYAHHGL